MVLLVTLGSQILVLEFFLVSFFFVPDWKWANKFLVSFYFVLSIWIFAWTWPYVSHSFQLAVYLAIVKATWSYCCSVYPLIFLIFWIFLMFLHMKLFRKWWAASKWFLFWNYIAKNVLIKSKYILYYIENGVWMMQNNGGDGTSEREVGIGVVKGPRFWTRKSKGRVLKGPGFNFI